MLESVGGVKQKSPSTIKFLMYQSEILLLKMLLLFLDYRIFSIAQFSLTVDVELLYPPRTVRANCWTGPLMYGDSFVQNILLDGWKYGGGKVIQHSR